MRILVIGGNGFIGSPLVSESLGCGHEVAVFHLCSDVGLADSGVVQIQGDRNRLSDCEGQLRRFSPDVIVAPLPEQVGPLPVIPAQPPGRRSPETAGGQFGKEPDPWLPKSLPDSSDEQGSRLLAVGSAR